MDLQGVSSAASVHKPAVAPHDSERVEAALAAFRGITDAQLAGQLATLVLRLEGVLHPSPGMVQNAA